MVRHYKRKTERASIDGSLMSKAAEEVLKGRSVRSVASDLGVNRTTLARYVKQIQAGEIGLDKLIPRYNSRQVGTVNNYINFGLLDNNIMS